MTPIPLEPIIREGVGMWAWLKVITSGIALFGGMFFLWSHEKHIQRLHDRIEELETERKVRTDGGVTTDGAPVEDAPRTAEEEMKRIRSKELTEKIHREMRRIRREE
ncbi:hypothetical protein [Halocatena marina]|uniref:hypothetical protein n=1 Tax=Halocatena marina TaxID=2934937 RepID=UPI002010AB99|nr:hypothetical protein [Halocatena marina]